MAWREGDAWDPRNPANKERTRALAGDLRQRLLTWDPIGVANWPEAQDEYDCLISPLMHRLHDGVVPAEVADWLIQELQDHFGIDPDAGRERRLVAELHSWWASTMAEPEGNA